MRLFCDCRHGNVWFQEPDNVTARAGETLGNLEVGEDGILYISEADLSNAFYRLELPLELRGLFTFRRARARDIGLIESGACLCILGCGSAQWAGLGRCGFVSASMRDWSRDAVGGLKIACRIDA